MKTRNDQEHPDEQVGPQLTNDDQRHLDGEPTRLSRSVLWDLQREYFETRGLAAWSQAVVPHFVTSNAFIAHAYARQVLAFLRDVTATGLAEGEPLYVVELAAGSGRFAHYFLKAWAELTCGSAELAQGIRYVLTDTAASLVDFWPRHPQFANLAESGMLDFARFDLETDQRLKLRHSGLELSPGSARNPMVAIANYAFDSVRQDAFAVSGGELLELRATLVAPTPPGPGDDQEEVPGHALDSLRLIYDPRPATLPYYQDPILDQLLEEYRETVGNGHWLIPIAALHACRHLQALADHGLLLLSADMGSDRVGPRRGAPPPPLSRHGSIAFPVNYHAIGHWVETVGGVALQPRSAHGELAVNTFLLGPITETARETRRVAAEVLDGPGPDTFFMLKKRLDQSLNEMPFCEVLAYLKLGFWDTHVARLALPRLGELAARGLEAEHKQALVDAAERVWERHLHIGETRDLAFDFGSVLGRAGLHRAAVKLFSRSLECYGEHTATLFNLAFCHFQLSQLEEAGRCCQRALELDDTNADARDLLRRLETRSSVELEIDRLNPKPFAFKSESAAYRDNLEHLRGELALLNLRLEREVSRWRATHPTETSQQELMGFQLSDFGADTALASLAAPELRDLLLSNSGDDPYAFMAPRIALHAERTRAALEAGVELYLPELTRRLELSDFESHVVLLTLAPELDQRYERLFGYLNDEMSRRWPTVELALRLFATDAADRGASQRAFDPAANLQGRRLLMISHESAPLPLTRRARGLRLEPRIVDFLLHGGAPGAGIGTDPELAGRLAWSRLDGNPPAPVSGQDALRDEISELRAFLAQRPSQPPILSLSGPDTVQLHRVASHLLGDARLLILPGAALAAAEDPEDLVARALRETDLSDAALLLEEASALSREGRPALALHRFLTAPCTHPRLLVAADVWPMPESCQAVPILTLHLPAPDQPARQELWRRALGELEIDVDLGELAGRFRLNSTQIAGAMARVKARARSRSTPGAVEQPISRGEIFTACRAQCLASLDGLAQRIESPYAWDDLVLPAAAKAKLRSLEHWLRYRHVVFETWGFAQRVDRAQGMAAMFSGSSGTGKTMAAGIIARALDLDLYSIDLSSVVSKYIGETEKNLARIFETAEAANAILFFDEADALFGKRSQVKDAHDRHANIEVSYLLQRMESFAGITILATNIRGNLDSAFLRRIQVIVDFPFPNINDRERIWRHLFPQQVPQSDDVDLEFLAKQFGLSGGNIKNCAVDAALTAAADTGTVGMKHLVRSVAREMDKVGKPVTRTVFGAYGGMLG